MRSLAKRTIEKMVARGGVSAIFRRFRPGGRLILAYHNIVPDDWVPSGDTSLHVSVTAFASQLDLIGDWAQVVPLSSFLDGTAEERIARVAITFDDAYLGAMSLGTTELARRGMPSTVFVAPGLLGGQEFWWDRHAANMEPKRFAAFRDRALWDWQGSHERIDGSTPIPKPRGRPDPHMKSATLEDLQALEATELVSVGSHTWSHPNLAAIPQSRLDVELTRPLEFLLSRFRKPIRWLAYPYGLENEAVRRAVQRCGYAAAVKVSGGWWDGSDDGLSIPRLNIPRGMTPDGFALRLAGVLGK